jgi:hypothetical protein
VRVVSSYRTLGDCLRLEGGLMVLGRKRGVVEWLGWDLAL